MACFRCNTTENFKFWPKHRQWKVDLNANEKLLVFVAIRQRKFRLYVQLSYTKISYLRKNTHLRKIAAFLHFRLKESSDNVIFPWKGDIQKLTKKMIFSVLFINFCKMKNIFFIHWLKSTVSILPVWSFTIPFLIRNGAPYFWFIISCCRL